MVKKDWLAIDVKSCTPTELVVLLEQLAGSQHPSLRADIQRELVNRLRAKGLSDSKVIDVLLHGVGRSTIRNEIASQWATALGMTAQEFKRIALGN